MVITSRFPYPIEKGDKLRLYYQLKELSKYHDITLCAITDAAPLSKDFDIINALCKKVYTFKRSKFSILKNAARSLLKGQPVQVGYFFDSKIKNAIHQIAKDIQPDHIYCQLLRTAAYVEDLPFPKTIDFMDTFSIGAKCWSERAHFLLKPILRREAKKVAAYEERFFKKFDHHTIISEQDRDFLPFEGNQQVAVIPNGVDTVFFQPMDVEKKYDAVFVGNMGYHPNVDAVKTFAKAILPGILKEFPDFTILIAGARPTPEIKQLQSKNIHISGWVDDIRTAYASADFFVAPLFIGMGMQNKILESMAMGIPCLTTPLVNNAIKATPERSILIAENTDAFVQQIIRMKKDRALINKVSEQGLTFVRNNFSWQSFVKKLNQVMMDE